MKKLMLWLFANPKETQKKQTAISNKAALKTQYGQQPAEQTPPALTEWVEMPASNWWHERSQ